MLEVLVDNVRLAEAELPAPLALENIAALFEWPDQEWSEAEFLYELCDRTKAMLLLDLANLHASACNFGTDPEGLPRPAPAGADRLRARGGRERGAGILYHDTHAHALGEGPVRLLRELCKRLGEPPPVLLERDEDFPTRAELEGELDAAGGGLGGLRPCPLRRRGGSWRSGRRSW